MVSKVEIFEDMNKKAHSKLDIVEKNNEYLVYVKNPSDYTIETNYTFYILVSVEKMSEHWAKVSDDPTFVIIAK